MGSAARGRLVRGASDLDIVAVVDGDIPFRGRVVGSELGDVEVVVYSVEEWCSY